MATFYNISQEEVESIVRYINDTENEQAIPTEEAIARLQNIYYVLQRKLTKRVLELEKKSNRLEKRVEKLESKEFKNVEEGVFEDLNIDSIDVAYALIYQLNNLDARYTKNKIVYILYEMYTSWLATHKQRLFLEHPVATEWGPQFWRVYKRLDIKNLESSKEGWNRLATTNSGVAAFAKRAAAKYCDYNEKDFKDFFTKSFPYKKASAGMNQGKWNKEISDSDIYAWKTEKQ